jgi:hypothetical protein
LAALSPALFAIRREAAEQMVNDVTLFVCLAGG